MEVVEMIVYGESGVPPTEDLWEQAAQTTFQNNMNIIFSWQQFLNSYYTDIFNWF